MTQDPKYPALDAAHAVLIAAYDATRFHAEPDLDGLVGRLRRTAAAVNDATVRACKGLAERGAHGELARARGMLRELADCVVVACRHGLDLAAASELMEYQTLAAGALARLAETLPAERLAA